MPIASGDGPLDFHHSLAPCLQNLIDQPCTGMRRRMASTGRGGPESWEGRLWGPGRQPCARIHGFCGWGAVYRGHLSALICAVWLSECACSCRCRPVGFMRNAGPLEVPGGRDVAQKLVVAIDSGGTAPPSMLRADPSQALVELRICSIGEQTVGQVDSAEA